MENAVAQLLPKRSKFQGWFMESLPQQLEGLKQAQQRQN
jgi:hypothetical protein